MSPRWIQWFGCFDSMTGYLAGTLLFAASLTPSLIPRTPLTQGLVSGISMAAGCGLGVAALRLWSYLELPMPGGQACSKTFCPGGYHTSSASRRRSSSFEWLEEPRGPDVSKKFRWFPLVTMLQLAVDIIAGTTAPTGYGHLLAPEHYIHAWSHVTNVQWTAEELARLKSHFARQGA